MNDALVFDADGYVDMDRFPDDGTDVDDAAFDDLRARLLADPVDEPGSEAWEDMCADAVAGTDQLDVDDSPFSDGSDPLFDDGLLPEDTGAEAFDHDVDPGPSDDDLDDRPDPDGGGDPFEVDGQDDTFGTFDTADVSVDGGDLPAVDDPFDVTDGAEGADGDTATGVDGVDGLDLDHGLDGLL